jgi:hypothetical protein
MALPEMWLMGSMENVGPIRSQYPSRPTVQMTELPW